jgi:hypothetical protein
MLWLCPLTPLPHRFRLVAGLILLDLEPLGMTKVHAEVTGASCLLHFGLNLPPL